MQIDLEMPVVCTGGESAELIDVVIDPRSRRLTHLVIREQGHSKDARLVPMDCAQPGDRSKVIALDWTMAQVHESEQIHEFVYLKIGELPEEGPDWDVGIQEMFAPAAANGIGTEMLGSGFEWDYDQHVAISYNRVPKGDVEIRRSSAVTSSEGDHLGHVVGFVIDEGQRISQLILEHGHLWGKRKVAIPAHSIERFAIDELVLNLSGDQVGAMKSLPAHHWGS